MNAIQKISTASLCILLACASNQPKSARNVTNFETGRHAINIEISSNSLAGGIAQFYYQVRAQCEGNGCVPQHAELIFSISTGSNDIYLENQSLLIQADGKHFKWERDQWVNIKNAQPVAGNIISVTLDLKTLKTIATSNTVTGSLGSNPFTWSYEKRKPLRVLLHQIKNNYKKSTKPEGRVLKYN